jgi:transposase
MNTKSFLLNVPSPKSIALDRTWLKQALQQWQGAVYQSDSSYHELSARCGFSYQRTAKVFRSRSAQQVAEFEEQLEKN